MRGRCRRGEGSRINHPTQRVDINYWWHKNAGLRNIQFQTVKDQSGGKMIKDMELE